MSRYKVAVGLVAAMIGVAAVTALAGASPDAKTGPAPAAQVDVPPLVSACPEAPWPYGCQWQEPVRRVQRSTRSF
jgi:hypothetical protein